MLRGFVSGVTRRVARRVTEGGRGGRAHLPTNINDTALLFTRSSAETTASTAANRMYWEQTCQTPKKEDPMHSTAKEPWWMPSAQTHAPTMPAPPPMAKPTPRPLFCITRAMGSEKMKLVQSVTASGSVANFVWPMFWWATRAEHV